MIEIPRAWQHVSEADAVQFMITADGEQRRIKLKRSENAALYDFITAHMGQSGS